MLLKFCLEMVDVTTAHHTLDQPQLTTATESVDKSADKLIVLKMKLYLKMELAKLVLHGQCLNRMLESVDQLFVELVRNF